MVTMKHAGLGVAALVTLLLMAGPAFAERAGLETVRHGKRSERYEREFRSGIRWAHPRWRHRHFGYVYPSPYGPRHCYAQGGYWAWDGWQHLWVPRLRVCR